MRRLSTTILAAAAGVVVGALLVAGLASAHDGDDAHNTAHDETGVSICNDLTGDHHLACISLREDIVTTQDWVMDIEGTYTHGNTTRALAARVDGNQAASLANLSLYNDLLERVEVLEGHVHVTGPPVSTTTTTTTTTAPPPDE